MTDNIMDTNQFEELVIVYEEPKKNTPKNQLIFNLIFPIFSYHFNNVFNDNRSITLKQSLTLQFYLMVSMFDISVNFSI